MYEECQQSTLSSTSIHLYYVYIIMYILTLLYFNIVYIESYSLFNILCVYILFYYR